MVKTSTILVLGAGASFDFGLPLGKQLLTDIRATLTDPQKIAELNSMRGITFGQAEVFGQILDECNEVSIDALLERRPEFMELGKTLIAMNLIPKENHEKLIGVGARGNVWYQRLFAGLETRHSFEALKENKLTILTYNYDRSLEHYLHTVTKTNYNKTDEEVTAMLKHIPIIHLHGQLAAYSPDNTDGRTYNGVLTQHSIDQARRGIRIICEADVAKDKCFADALERLRSAQRIVFLGFGYHEDNVTRLRINSNHGKEIIGTCLGMPHVEKSKAQRLLNGIKFFDTITNVFDNEHILD